MSTQFNAESLLAGDYAQLQKWELGTGNSIYVSWVPDQMDTRVANDYFNTLGEIDRIEFAPHKTGSGRMMFVHFKEWYMCGTEPIRAIATAYPGHHSMPIYFRDTYGNVNTYQLKCAVNTRPIKKVEYNIHQLADMFHQFKEQSEREIQMLKDEIARLNAIVEEVSYDAQIYPESPEYNDPPEYEYEEGELEQKNMSIRRNMNFGQGDRHSI
jgi:hypothetical protein